MDKNWIKRIKKNKATIALSKYLIFIIKQINEKNIHDEFIKKNLGYDEILIEEASKDILELNPKKKRRKFHQLTSKNIIKKGLSTLFDFKQKEKEERNVHLIYYCLLKFKGLIRYMNFQGLEKGDIKKISYYIKHIKFKKGEYVFRQGDKSDALYGVINGKVIIREIKPNDYFKKLKEDYFSGNLNEENFDSISNIPIYYFMSDCEEGSSESESESENNDNNNNENNNNNNKNNNKNNINNNKNNINNIEFDYNSDDEKRKKYKKKKSILNSPDSPEIIRRTREKINKLRFQKVEKETEDQIDRDIDKKVIWERRKEIDLKIRFKKPKKKIKKPKEKIIIKSLKEFQTPKEELKEEILFNFIKEFEYENFQITNGMCFGEWGLVYSIPRTTSIYCIEDCNLFYLEKPYFKRILSSKFELSDINKIDFLLKTFPILKNNPENNIRIGHLLTKIVPMFFENEAIVYTPFDKALNIFAIYQGECNLVSLKNPKNKDDYLMRKRDLKVISILTEGAISGFESCLDYDSNYNNALIISKEFTTLLKINIKVISEKYKDFKKSVYPMFIEHKKIYDRIKNKGDKIKMAFNLKRINDDKCIDKIVKNAMIKPKQSKFLNDFKYNNIVIDKFDVKKSKNKNKISINYSFKNTSHNNKLKIKLDKSPLFTFNNILTNENDSNKKKKKTKNIFHKRNYNSEKKQSKILSSSSKKLYSNYDNYTISTESHFFPIVNKIKEESNKLNKKRFLIRKILNNHKILNNSLSQIDNYNLINTLSPLISKKKFEFHETGAFTLPFLTESNK